MCIRDSNWANDGDQLDLNNVVYEENITIDGTKPKNLTINGGNTTKGNNSTITSSNITISNNCASLSALTLSATKISCTNTLSATNIINCYIQSSCDDVNDDSVSVILSNDGSTFNCDGTVLDGRLSTAPGASSNLSLIHI